MVVLGPKHVKLDLRLNNGLKSSWIGFVVVTCETVP